MKVNSNCEYAYLITVYFNAKKLDDCMEADDETGEVLICYRNASGRLVSEVEAENGAQICQGAQVIRLRGEVRIEIDYDYIKREMERSYKPLELKTVDYSDPPRTLSRDVRAL